MHLIKYLWAVRAIVYKLSFGNVGNMTYIGRPTFIEGKRNISIGNRVRIYPGIRMEALNGGMIHIGNNLAIEQNVNIISGTAVLNIGNDTTISANVFISNVDHEYTDVNKSVMDQQLQFKETQIGNSCFIGYGAVILPGTKLGNQCIVGANAVVRGTYPDNCVLVGNPAKIIKKYNSGLKHWETTEVERWQT